MHRRTIILLLITCLWLAGCALPSNAPAGTAPAEPAAPKTITHALGETAVPATPQRIVALEWTYVEDLLALGIQPIGVADIAGYNDWVQIPVELDADVVDVGTRQAPNLETLAGLNPDLILAPAFRAADIYEQLSAIAPTIAFDPYPSDESTTQYDEMRQTFLTIADVVGRHAEGEAVLAAMEESFAAARSRIETAGKVGEPFVLAQAFGEDTVQVRLFTDNAMAVEIVEQIGMENAWQESQFQPYGFSTVSIETLPELGNANFFYVVQDDNNVFTREAIAPVWESLEFVRNERAYPLGGDTWLFGGPLSAEVLVETVLNALGLDAPEGEASTSASFPVTIEHKYGSTTISESPERIVSVGFRDHEHLLALGVIPVGVRDWYGNGYPTIFWPWAEEAIGDAQPDIIGAYGEINFEKVAALQPDLIIGVYSGMTEDEYEILTQIAPTVPQSGEYIDWGMPWQEETRMIGRAVGQAEKAETLVSEIEAGFAQVRADHPEFEGTTIAIGQLDTPGDYYLLSPDDHKARFFTMLGFEVPEDISEVVGAQSNLLISQERLDLFDRDLLVWLVGSEQGWADGPAMADAVRNNAIYQQLSVVRSGRDIFATLPADALAWSTPLSLPFALQEFVPLLAQALSNTN